MKYLYAGNKNQGEQNGRLVLEYEEDGTTPKRVIMIGEVGEMTEAQAASLSGLVVLVPQEDNDNPSH